MGPTYPAGSAQSAVDEAPAPVLAGLGGLHHRVPGRRGSARWRAAAARSRSSHVPARRGTGAGAPRRWPSRTQSSQLAARRPARRRGVPAEVRRRRRRAGDAADRLGALELRAPGVADVEHRLLDVEHREHVLDHLVRDRPGAADRAAPAALGVDHLQPDPGVDLARRLLVGGGCRRAAPRPRSCAASTRCRSTSTTPCGSSSSSARRAARSRPWTPAEQRRPGPARPPAGPATARRSRRASHGSDEPLDEQRAGHDGERDQQQHLAVVGASPGSRTPRPA